MEVYYRKEESENTRFPNIVFAESWQANDVGVTKEKVLERNPVAYLIPGKISGFFQPHHSGEERRKLFGLIKIPIHGLTDENINPYDCMSETFIGAYKWPLDYTHQIYFKNLEDIEEYLSKYHKDKIPAKLKFFLDTNLR